MANINSTTNTATAANYRSKGITGLATGMNTEEVVEAMTSDVQAKIDKVKQDQQRYGWKQEAYREAITSLINFQDKYFTYSSSSNLLNSSLFNCTSMVPSGSNASKISVSGTSSTTKATYSVTGVSQLATKAGFTSGGSKTSSDIATGDISFSPRDASIISGGSLSLKYGSETYNISVPNDVKPKTAQELADVLNKAMEANSVSTGGKLSDKLKFTAGSDGKMHLGFVNISDTNSFSIKGGSDEVLKALRMEVDDKSAGGNISGKGPVREADLIKVVDFTLEGKSLTFDLNGNSKTIEFTKAESDAVTNITQMQELIQKKIDEKFGKDKIRVAIPSEADGTPKNQLSFITVKSDGSGGQAYDDTSLLKVSSQTGDTLGETGLFNLKNGAKNRLDTASTLKEMGFTASGQKDGKNIYEFEVNGVKFSFGDDDSVSSVISKMNNDPNAGVNVTFLSTSGRFSVTADESGAHGKVDFKDLGSGDMIEGLFGASNIDTETNAGVTKGQDMKMSVRYEGSTSDVELTRSSNAVSIDGINFTVKEEFSAYDASGVYKAENAISFTSKSDTENTIKVIKEMAEDYNKILESVNEMASTKANKDYKPLTDAQRKEMTTDEIKVWEDKAKEGIMFGDSTLKQLATDMRFLFSTAITNVGSPSSIGISTSSSYSDNGKIVIDEKKLKEALETDPDKVKAIFTSSKEASPGPGGSKLLDGGLSIRMQTVMESYAKSTGSQKGKLVDLAGIKNNPTTQNNYIERQQKILSNNLDYLTDLLKTRRDRYQGQFTNLEVYVSKMNAQSSWLQSAMGQ